MLYRTSILEGVIGDLQKRPKEAVNSVVNLKRKDQQEAKKVGQAEKAASWSWTAFKLRKSKSFQLARRQNKQGILPQNTGRTNPIICRVLVFWPPELKENKFLF